MRHSTVHHPRAVRPGGSTHAVAAAICLSFLASSPSLVGAENPDPAIIATVNANRPTEVSFHIRNATPTVARLVGWEFGDATPGSTVKWPSHRYKKPGEYTVRLLYRNAAGKDKSLVRSINLLAPPVVDINDYGTLSSATGTKLWFSAAGKQGKDKLDTRTAKWDFGDGGRARGDRVEHVFKTPREYTVKVSFEDESKMVATDWIVVDVKAPKPSTPKPEVPKPPVPKPPTPVPPAPRPTFAVNLDFEKAPAGLDGVALAHSSVAAHAHAGTGSLEAHLDQGPAFFDALSKLLTPTLTPFLLADNVHAQWFVQWDAALEVDAMKLRPLLEKRLADSPGALAAAQTLEMWKLVAVIEAAADSFPSIAPGTWHCFEVSYTFPEDAVPGSLELKLDGTTLLSFDALSILEHLPAVEAVLDQVFGGKVVVTSATRAWVDDLRVSTEPTPCN